MSDKATVLAVDDTPESLALLVDVLTAAGYEVRPADSGELALAAVAANLPDLILLDVRMPGMDGLEVCRRIKARDETRHIPILLISAFADVQEAVDGLQAGAVDYIVKPFQIEELLTRVKTHLALSRADVSLAHQAVALRQVNERLQSEMDARGLTEEELRLHLARAERSRLVLLSTVEDQRQTQIARDRLLREQVALNRITLSLGALTELPAVLRTLYDEVRTLLDADGFFASRYHKDTQLITALFAIDEGGELDVSTFPPVPLAPEGHGMQSQVLRTGKPLNVPDWLEGERKMQTVHHLAPDGTFTPPPPDTERDDCTKSALLVPLLSRGEPIGVLQVQSNRLNAYSQEDEDLLGGLGNVAAISIQNALLIEEAGHDADELRLSLEGTLHAVSAAAETRDPYTAGHQRRVTAIALAIARELGCSDDECNALRIAGTVHDIGKLGIPAEILSKPGMLAPIELALIREHPQTAYNILADVPFPGPVAEIVLQHHERLDGSGYPRGLTGEQTLREARILAVADVVEAMASHRPYRPARGIDAALGEIEQNAGRLYDSEAVEACIHLFRDKGYVLPA
jgi:response regulator RpfG family c-di-GMP phosphodiesterase